MPTTPTGHDLIEWPLPSVAGLRLRHYRGEGDLPAMVAVANASDAADGIRSGRTLEGTVAAYRSLGHCDPFADMVLAQVGESLVGYARGWWRDEVGGAVLHIQTGFVDPAWRRRGIGRTLLGWLEARQRAIASGLAPKAPQLFNVYVTEGERGRAALLESAGYYVERYLMSMVRPHLWALPAFALPPGLEIRSVLPAHYRAIWEADQEAMRGHWGMAEPLPDAFETWQRADSFQPPLWSVAWDVASGQVVGQVRAFIVAAENAQHGRLRGYTEFISVREPWRGRGVARALIAHSLAQQARAGMAESALEVDSDNPADATRIYEACGFGTTACNRVYRKRL